MELIALSSAFDGVNVLFHGTGSDNDVYSEGVRNDERMVEHRDAEASSHMRHAEKS